jgi:predicted acyltransferase
MRKVQVIAGLAVALALAYWAVMMLVPPPGGVAGDLSPEGNLGAFIDRTLMPGHLWRSAPGDIFPRGHRWDPEGLLSTVPALTTTLLGLIAGIWLSAGRTPSRTAAGLALAGIAAIAVGEIWHLAFPINKNIWTSSYAVFTAGAASLLLALCYWIIDVKGWRGWTKPFVILGTNAITLFVLSGLLVKTLALIRVAEDDGRVVSISRYAYLHYFLPLASPKNASLLWALTNLVVLFGVLAWMYRRRLFLRV